MHSKALKIILLIIGFSTLAAAVGFWLGRILQAKGPIKAGPLVIHLNESSGEYAVYDDGEPMALKRTNGDETIMTFFGKSGRASVDVTLTYKSGTTELKECDFSTSEGNVVGGPITYSYGDIDGDGRFDRFGDHKAGKAYELKGLEWKLNRPAQPKDK